MTFQVISEAGEALDAHLDIEGDEFVFHSRGGKRGEPGARNLDYGAALRLLLERIAAAKLRLSGAWIDSDEVLHLPRASRSVLDEAELGAGPSEQFRSMSRRMQTFGRAPGAPYGGSRVKKVRIRVTGAPNNDLATLLGVRFAPETPRTRRRIPEKVLRAVTAEHIWQAVEHLKADHAPHDLGEAREFEVIADEDVRLSPKAVLGVAASLALGVEIDPDDVSDSAASLCHRTLEAAGFEIVRRGEPSRRLAVPMSDEERVWAEGQPKLVLHLKRERAAGLSMAKKESFRRRHGRLYCERCGLDPVRAFGAPAAEACIEVHHNHVQISEMSKGAVTSLDQLECLCANCHRLVHALARQDATASVRGGVGHHPQIRRASGGMNSTSSSGQS